jgi:excisionase family DNA binding protein
MSAPKPDLDRGSLIPLSEAAKRTPYTVDFIRQLARSRKITAVKIGRDWLTTSESVLHHIHDQQKRHRRALQLLSSAERSLV